MSDEHYTPKWLFEAIGLEFDLDPASPEIGSNVPAKIKYTIHDDGLSKSWSGRVWLNPPFSNPTPWIHKFIENANGMCIVPISRSKWFDAIWNACDGLAKTPYNLKFDRPDGSSKQISFQTFIFAIGEDNLEALRNANLGKVR